MRRQARAIGVSNYCQSSLRCIARAANVTPAVNQIKYHIGVGLASSACSQRRCVFVTLQHSSQAWAPPLVSYFNDQE